MLEVTNTPVDGIASPPNWPEGLFPHAQTFLISTCTIINHAQQERTGARICFPVVASNQPRSAFCLVSVPGVCLLQCTHCNLRLKKVSRIRRLCCTSANMPYYHGAPTILTTSDYTRWPKISLQTPARWPPDRHETNKFFSQNALRHPKIAQGTTR